MLFRSNGLISETLGKHGAKIYTKAAEELGKAKADYDKAKADAKAKEKNQRLAKCKAVEPGHLRCPRPAKQATVIKSVGIIKRKCDNKISSLLDCLPQDYIALMQSAKNTTRKATKLDYLQGMREGE